MSKVLVVEDDPIQSAILADFFGNFFHCEVIEAANGQLGLEAIHAHRSEIHFVATDIEMPVMGGLEFLRALKDAKYRGQVAVISGLPKDLVSRTETLAKMHGLNIIGVCEKPLAYESLYTLVSNRPVAKSSANASRKSKPVGPSYEELREGLMRGEFIPHYQPKVSISTGKIVGVEALARWNHPTLGLVSPGVFIPMIEQEDATDQLTFSMLNAALKDLQRWRTDGAELKVAVNITSCEISDYSLPDRISEAIAQYRIEPDQLVLEVTENMTLELNATALEVLMRLRIMGVDVAIDDFGTGFANIKTLQDFPYSELKIDQSFIRSAISDEFSHQTVQASIALGRQKGLRVLAEGVETLADWKYVETSKIDEVQGYLVSKPLPADDFMSFYQENRHGVQFDRVA